MQAKGGLPSPRQGMAALARSAAPFAYATGAGAVAGAGGRARRRGRAPGV
jgi:hypothetical protein